MNQANFIYNTRHREDIDTSMTICDSTVSLHLRPTIIVIHDSKDNVIYVSFIDMKQSFKLKDDDQLRKVYNLHKTNINLTEILYSYCKDNMELSDKFKFITHSNKN